MISVIVPVYNSEKYLEKCVHSILAQQEVELEVILVNDGSKDTSLAICHRLAEGDSRVRVLDYPNGGAAAARNRGLEAARGEQIGFVDSDDWLEPHMYATLLRAMEEHCADIVECGAWYVPENGGEARAHALRPRVLEGTAACAVDYADLKNSYQCTWNKLYRREVIGPVRYQPYAQGEDALFNAEVILRCGRKVVLEDCLYHYLVRPGGLGLSVRAGTELDGTRALISIYRLLAPYGEEHCVQLARRIADKALGRLADGMAKPPENWRAIRRELKAAYICYYKKICAVRPMTLRQRIGFTLFCLMPEAYIRYNYERK